MQKFVSRDGYEINCSRREFTRRNDYPYGKWTCATGREILFNRFYEPIWQRLPNGDPHQANANEWVPWIRQELLYRAETHTEAESRRIGAAVLASWGLPEPEPTTQRPKQGVARVGGRQKQKMDFSEPWPISSNFVQGPWTKLSWPNSLILRVNI
jgi:hypothetical protein